MKRLEHPIDFVITWVDGNDPLWIADKSQFSPKNKIMNGAERFRDWDNLQYLFRAFELFTPWVNKIFFVTYGHLPIWLNTKHPKLRIVQHEDFLDGENLPLFNINAIETNFHKISELSEHFVYFNDDCFLLQPLTPHVFFKKGLPVDVPICNIMHEGVIAPIVLNDIDLINKNFNRHKGEKLTKRGIMLKHFTKWFNVKYGKGLINSLLLLYWKTFTGFLNYHHPQPFLKKTYRDVWEKEGEILTEVSKSRFRDNTDVNQYLFRYWQFAQGQFSPGDYNSSYVKRKHSELRTVSDVEKAAFDIASNKYQMLCLNDAMSKGRFTTEEVTDENFEYCKTVLQKAFDAIFPSKSSFEK